MASIRNTDTFILRFGGALLNLSFFQVWAMHLPDEEVLFFLCSVEKDVSMKLCLFVFSLFLPLISFAATPQSTVGKVSELRVYMEDHVNVNARGNIGFAIDSPLAAPCTSFYYSANENVATSILIAAKAIDGQVKVSYYTDVVAPWNSKTCKVYTVEAI